MKTLSLETENGNYLRCTQIHEASFYYYYVNNSNEILKFTNEDEFDYARENWDTDVESIEESKEIIAFLIQKKAKYDTRISTLRDTLDTVYMQFNVNNTLSNLNLYKDLSRLYSELYELNDETYNLIPLYNMSIKYPEYKDIIKLMIDTYFKKYVDCLYLIDLDYESITEILAGELNESHQLMKETITNAELFHIRRNYLSSSSVRHNDEIERIHDVNDVYSLISELHVILSHLHYLNERDTTESCEEIVIKTGHYTESIELFRNNIIIKTHYEDELDLLIEKLEKYLQKNIAWYNYLTDKIEVNRF